MAKRTIIIVIALAICAVAGMYVYRSRNQKPTDRIVISGNIELTEIDVGFKYSGKLIERTVTEGDAVQKGAVLARLDQEQLLHQRAREQAALQACANPVGTGRNRAAMAAADGRGRSRPEARAVELDSSEAAGTSKWGSPAGSARSHGCCEEC